MRYLDAAHTMIDAGNGRMIPVDPGNRHYVAIVEAGTQIADYVPGQSVSEPSGPVTIEMVKAEAARRILDRYPLWKQVNMDSRETELIKLMITRSAWTASEAAEVQGIDAAHAWIRSVRAASDVLEAAQTIPDDYANDRHWPSAP